MKSGMTGEVMSLFIFSARSSQGPEAGAVLRAGCAGRCRFSQLPWLVHRGADDPFRVSVLDRWESAFSYRRCQVRPGGAAAGLSGCPPAPLQTSPPRPICSGEEPDFCLGKHGLTMPPVRYMITLTICFTKVCGQAAGMGAALHPGTGRVRLTDGKRGGDG